MITEDTIRKLPKVELHDHLDGGLRPRTIIELADRYSKDIPSHDPAELAAWFRLLLELHRVNPAFHLLFLRDEGLDQRFIGTPIPLTTYMHRSWADFTQGI